MKDDRQEVLEFLVKHPEVWGVSTSIDTWEYQDGQYIHSLYDPITIDDWNRAKIVPNTKIRILSSEHSKHVQKLAFEAGFKWQFGHTGEAMFINEYGLFINGEGITYAAWGSEFDRKQSKEIFIELPVSKESDINSRVLAEKTGSKHSHYFKDVSNLDEIDVYRVCDLFEVNDESGAKQHAIKKLLCSGKRGAKDERKDLEEARDTIIRKLEMMMEDNQ